jgi:hypothetical protein
VVTDTRAKEEENIAIGIEWDEFIIKVVEFFIMEGEG